MTIKYLLSVASLAVSFAVQGGTHYTFEQCEGSLTPYPEPELQYAVPDTLTPVFVNHVGRHGSRYPASGANCLALRRLLERADSLGTITPLGRELRALNEAVITESNNRWGALDSLGMAEQQGIAARMFCNYAEVFGGDGTVEALSSYSPRSMMSMYSFTYSLARLNNRLTFTTSAGRLNSPLVRPFDTDSDYADFRRGKAWEPAYKEYFTATAPAAPARRVLGEAFPFADDGEARDASLVEYYVLAGLPAMSFAPALDKYFTSDEANALWSCFNLRQYLQRTATTVSTVPADIAAALVMNIIETTDAYIEKPEQSPAAILRFGHAETLMPLLSLLRLPGCYYLTNYFDTVAEHWRDFEVVPMAANIQFVLLRSAKGRYYVRVDLNEKPVALRPGDTDIYYPWGELRRFMLNAVPLYAQ